MLPNNYLIELKKSADAPWHDLEVGMDYLIMLRHKTEQIGNEAI